MQVKEFPYLMFLFYIVKNINILLVLIWEIFRGIVRGGIIDQVQTTPFWMSRKGKSPLTFRKNPIRQISFETFVTVFDRASIQCPRPTAVKFFRETCPCTPLDCLHLQRSKTPYPSVYPLSKNPCYTYDIPCYFRTFSS